MNCSLIVLTLSALMIVTDCYPQDAEAYKRQQGRVYPYQHTQNHQHAKILRHENNIDFGRYNFAYETSDGSHREEKAELKNAGSENEALSVQGSYTYVGTDGVTYKVTYIADENGYRASGEHLPKIS